MRGSFRKAGRRAPSWRGLLAAAATLVLAAWVLPAQAADAYPSRPIRLLVGYAAGGPTDIAARRLGSLLSGQLGQPVVVENKPGVSGMIAMNQLAKAPADGYTVALATTPVMAISPVLNTDQAFDPIDDFTPVARFVEYGLVLLVPRDSPFTSLDALISHARAHPGALSYSSSGVGGTAHVSAELFAQRSGAQFLHVPYKGSAPALADLMAGVVDFTFEVASTAEPAVKSGKLRALAVTSLHRNPAFEGVPTLAESNMPGLEVTGWFGIFAPRNLPAAVRDRLADAIDNAVRQPDFQQYASTGGISAAYEAPAPFSDRLAKDVAFWKDILDKAGIQ